MCLLFSQAFILVPVPTRESFSSRFLKSLSSAPKVESQQDIHIQSESREEQAAGNRAGTVSGTLRLQALYLPYATPVTQKTKNWAPPTP